MPADDRSLRIAFPAGEWLDWLGGLNYHRNLLRAVASDPSSRIEPMLFLGSSDEDHRLHDFPDVPRVRSRLLDRRGPAWALRGMTRRMLERDPLFERLLDSHGVRAVSHSSRVWRSSRLAMLGWIPDFQHRRLPEFFAADERRRRDAAFARIARLSTTVVVSSEAARRDLADFDRAAAERSRVLHFVVEPPEPDSLPPREELAERYGLEGPYLHVPNQFWAHKNHIVLIEALRIMRDRGAAPAPILATGATDDYRRPELFESLRRRAVELGVEELFRPLGVLPYRDVAGLMRDSVAVINPSLCEGWSTSVEEAKSLGKRVLVSDIDVHREQDPPSAVFFDPRRADELADAMAVALAADAREAELLAEAATEALPGRLLAFTRAYERIVVEAVGP